MYGPSAPATTAAAESSKAGSVRRDNACRAPAGDTIASVLFVGAQDL